MPEALDVCVIGGGPAGLTVALTLGAGGRRVVLLESGDLDSSTRAQELNHYDHEGEPYAGLDRTRHRQLGGGTNIWDVVVNGRPGAKYLPLSTRDLADWPIGWDELGPYYIEAQALCGLGPFEYGPDHWCGPGRRPFDLDGTGLTSAVYQFGYAERFSRELVDELLAAETVSLLTSTTAVELEVDWAARRLRAVRAADGDGDVVEVKAETVVLACGAVENARLLMLAHLDSEWLGRCFMEHARDFSLALLPDSPELFTEAAFYDLFTAEGVLVGGHLAITDDALDSHHLPNGALTLLPRLRGTGAQRLAAHAPVALRRLARLMPQTPYGWSRVRSPARAFDRFGLVLNLEQRPHPRNRIELSDRRDRFGNRLPRLVLHWTDDEQAGLERLRERLGGWFQAAGLGRLLTTGGKRPDLSAHHHAGTTRMAHDPYEGVVDPDGRMFRVDNLYVTGGSVFPSAGFANPTLTVVALARRLASHLLKLS